MTEHVDWQRQVAEYASKSRRHSQAVEEAQQHVESHLIGEDRWEAIYTLAVQRIQLLRRVDQFEAAQALAPEDQLEPAEEAPALEVKGFAALAEALRTMYDSTSPWDIPRNAQMVAYYVDGRYAWPQAWLDLFPNAVKVGISAIGQRTAVVGDVEVGCIWPPANAVPWVRRARADGYDPTIYVNELNDWLPVRQAFWAAGEPEPHYWTARYNGVAQVPDGAVARQYAHPHDGDGIADKPWETGAHYDKSAVRPHWPGVDNGGPGGGGGGGGVSRQDVFDAFAYAAENPDSPEAENIRQVIVHYKMPKALIGGETSIHIETSHAAANFQEVLIRLATIAEAVGTIGNVTLTPEQLEELKGALGEAQLAQLEPLFELARRLES